MHTGDTGIHAHEIFDDTVELGALVPEAQLGAIFPYTGRKCAEVLDCFGNSLRVINEGQHRPDSGVGDTYSTVKPYGNYPTCRKSATQGEASNVRQNVLRPKDSSPCLMSK